MESNFITLTFFREACNLHGTGAGPTEKTFCLNHNHIEYMVEYGGSGTKICLRSGSAIYVNESTSTILRRIDNI